ncbi:MAG TPA: ABC transporter ATP-binding protein [Myxococcales bacterium]|nr:ABC transporter ATP-binding protein [Myxococcales bacterium]
MGTEAPPPPELPVQARGLSKTYRLGFWMNRKVHALEGLDLELHPGEAFGLLGPNGAGKSTTLKILMNLVQASSGQARLFGRPPSDEGARRRVGYLPENPAPYEYLTGREFVKLCGTLCGLSGAELDGRVKEVLGVVGMERAADLLVRRYSKGMIQRIALAQALIHRPALLVLDEPTSGLDPVGRRLMRDIILEERQRGTTVLFCTHIIPDVEAVCDRVAVLVGGRAVRRGTTRELLSAEAPRWELAVEGMEADAVRALAAAAVEVQAVAGRVVARGPDAEVQALLRQVVAGGGRVTRLQPLRFSLEDLFMEALKEARGGTVGSEIE